MTLDGYTHMRGGDIDGIAEMNTPSRQKRRDAATRAASREFHGGGSRERTEQFRPPQNISYRFLLSILTSLYLVILTAIKHLITAKNQPCNFSASMNDFSTF